MPVNLIEFQDNDILVSGVPVKDLVANLETSGYTNAQIADLIGNILVGAANPSPPPDFEFSVEVPAEAPHCSVQYEPQFAHVDWIDGESRVQAGMTPEELGINARFHAIEDEFSSIAAEFARCADCVAELRGQLHTVVSELEAKITELQDEIHRLKQSSENQGGGGGIIGPYYPPGGSYQPQPLPQPQPQPQPWPGGPMPGGPMPGGPIPGGPMPGGGGPWPWGPWTGGGTPWTNPGNTGVVDPGDPRILEHGIYGGAVGDSGVDPLILLHNLNDFGQTIVQDQELEDELASGALIDEIAERRGSTTFAERSGTNLNLGDGLRVLPGGSDPRSTAELHDQVIRSTVGGLGPAGGRIVRSGLLDAEAARRTGGAVLNTSVDSLRTVSEDTTQALKAAGYTSIGRLSRGSLSEVQRRLAESGQQAAADEVGEAVTAAKMLAETRNL